MGLSKNRDSPNVLMAPMFEMLNIGTPMFMILLSLIWPSQGLNLTDEECSIQQCNTNIFEYKTWIYLIFVLFSKLSEYIWYSDWMFSEYILMCMPWPTSSKNGLKFTLWGKGSSKVFIIHIQYLYICKFSFRSYNLTT